MGPNLDLGSTQLWVSNPSGSGSRFGFDLALGLTQTLGFFLCGLREEEKGERREMGFGKKKVKRRESKNDGRLKMKRKENKKKKFKEKK